MTLWLCARYVRNYDGEVWELQGIFSSEEAAIAACRSSQHFVGPVEVDKRLPERTVDWRGLYYPRGQKERP